jgi:hypothetical protein
VQALGLALRAKYRYGVPLKRAFPMVREALRRPGLRKKDALVRDVFTYLPTVKRRIRFEEAYYKPLPRGPGWRDPYHPEMPAVYRRHPAVRRAIQWGLDLSLNESNLWRTREQLVRDWAESVRGFDLLRGGAGAVNPVALCEQLIHAGVRFVVIGGAAGNLHGSVRVTNDLDVCYDPAPDSTGPLVALLNAWHARLHVPREPDARLPFVIDERTFRHAPALSLITDHGRLDLLPTVAGIGDYAACVGESQQVRTGSVDVRVLTLDALIKAKRAAGRDRDREHLIELEAMRAMKRIAEKEFARRRRRR